MNKPKIEDIVTAFSALRLVLVEDAGVLGSMATSERSDAAALRRLGKAPMSQAAMVARLQDFAAASEQRAADNERMGMRLADALQTIGRILGDPSPPRHRTGEWRPPTPEETAESLADTRPLDRGEVAEANANDKDER